jgi:hypothetical protein
MSSSSPGVTVGGPATVVIEDNDKPGENFKLWKHDFHAFLLLTFTSASLLVISHYMD